MKTIKILLLIALVVALMVSCNTYYRMVTTLDRDGNAYREVYTKGDSAFLAGDLSQNPYLFDISSGWHVDRLDSAVKYNFFGEEVSFNVVVRQSVSSIDLLSKNLRYKENLKSLAAPKESLSKKFRWFYTNYIFTGVYEKLIYQVPVSIDKYLTKDEQKLWTQGDFSNYKALNGAEMNDLLGEIEGKFMEWYAHNCFELSLASIKKFSIGNDLSDSDKDKIYKQIRGDRNCNSLDDIDPKSVCKALDLFYQTNNYSQSYNAQKNLIDKEFEASASVILLLGNQISYELIVPGEILESNSPIVNANTLTWKIDGVRLLLDDYTLTAEYRVANVYAFILSGLVVIVAIMSGLLLLRKKRK